MQNTSHRGSLSLGAPRLTSVQVCSWLKYGNIGRMPELQTPRTTRWHSPLVQKFIRKYNDKNSATIVSTVVYIAGYVKHTNFWIFGFTAECCQKYTSHTKKLEIKKCLKLNFVQKSPWAHMSISPWSGARVLERLACSKYYDVGKWQHSIWGSTRPKIRITRRKGLNESCSNLNFIQKSLRAHMSTNPRSGARRLERLIWLKYNIVQKWQITFNLGLNAAKNTHYTKKRFK